MAGLGTKVLPVALSVLCVFKLPGAQQTERQPVLTRDNGKPLPFDAPRILSFPNRMGNLVGSPFQFQQHGQSGAEVSEVFPHVAGVVDDLCIIRSIQYAQKSSGLFIAT